MGRRGIQRASPARAAPLERAQEGDELGLLGSTEAVEVVGHGLCFVAGPLNGVKEGVGAAVVQQLRAGACSPRRRRSQFRGGLLPPRLYLAGTGWRLLRQGGA